MTLQDIIDLILAADSKGLARDVAVTRAVLLAYELGRQSALDAVQTWIEEETP